MPATSGAPERDSDAAGPPRELTPGLRWRRVFPGDERQLSVLRRWLASLLPQCPARDDVTAVANELGSNAIQHTSSGRGGWFAVEITWYGPVVRIAVTDSGAPTGPQVIDDPRREHGRGLLVVRALSVRTGACGDHRGRLVWADVRWDATATAGAATPDAYEAAIRDGEAALARRFAGVPAWFGRTTLAWWALPGADRLVTAPTAEDLAGLLYRLLDTPHPLQPGATAQPHRRPAGPRADRRDQHGRASGPGAVLSTRPGPGSGTGHCAGPDGWHREPEGPGGSSRRVRVPAADHVPRAC